jgi:hypothetical protein
LPIDEFMSLPEEAQGLINAGVNEWHAASAKELLKALMAGHRGFRQNWRAALWLAVALRKSLFYNDADSLETLSTIEAMAGIPRWHRAGPLLKVTLKIHYSKRTYLVPVDAPVFVPAPQVALN